MKVKKHSYLEPTNFFIVRTGNNNFEMNFYLVFEYCHTDLNKVLKETGIQNPADRKKIMYQLLKGIDYMHK